MSKIKAFPILAAAFLFAAVALAANAQEASAPKHTLSPEQLAALKTINGEETNQSAPLAIELNRHCQRNSCQHALGQRERDSAPKIEHAPSPDGRADAGHKRPIVSPDDRHSDT